MSELTPNLKLFKYNTETDAKQPFSINDCMNANWDKIDASLGSLEICDIGMSLYVDETKGKRRYLNGQIVDRNANTEAFFTRLKDITTLHQSLLCTEEEWQTAKTLSAFGQVGKFVFNYSGDEIVSVRIPAIVNVQGLFDLQNLGMTVEAGLPNITGSVSVFADGAENVSDSALIKNGSGSTSIVGTSANLRRKIDLDASRSSSIYGNSDTVQQEAIQYPYFIQIATGSETEANITNKFENTNPQTLLESKYSDKPLYNESWLLSNGQWNAKAVYPTVYEALQVEYNSEIEAGTTVTLPSGLSYTKRGLSVKLSTEEYTDYDFALNTADETFRLPLLDGVENIVDYSNGTTFALATNFTVPSNGVINVATNGYGGREGSWYWTVNGGEKHYFGGNNGGVYPITVLVSKDDIFWVNGNSDAENTLYFYPYKGNGSLYYYIGDTDQNHGIVNMGRIGEQLANKQDKCIHIIDTYVNGTSGYRIWSDGYCEQWGRVNISGTDANNTVNFVKTFKDTDYVVVEASFGNTDRKLTLVSLHTSNMVIRGWANTSIWKACGYLASGQY